jgi:hypothetical protein
VSERNDDIIDYLYRSTEGDPSKWNEPFRLNFMAFNPHGPGLVSRFKMMDGLIKLAEDENEKEGWDDPDDRKFLQFLKSVPEKSKKVLFAAGSIEAKTLGIVLTKKQLGQIYHTAVNDPNKAFGMKAEG